MSYLNVAVHTEMAETCTFHDVHEQTTLAGCTIWFVSPNLLKQMAVYTLFKLFPG